jgi:RecA-family ATPase
MQWLPRLADDNILTSFADNGRSMRTPLFERLLFATKALGAELVIIDTLADVFSGQEMVRGQARKFVQETLALIAREIKGAVIALAHPSLTGINSGTGTSGSTSWDGTFRSRLYLSTPKLHDGEPPDPYARVLTRKKSNYALRDETIEMRWQNGVFVVKQQLGGIIGSIERHHCERVFLDLLNAVMAEGRYVSDKERAANFAPKLFATRPDREGYSKAEFTRAMQNLFAQKKIRIGVYCGPDRHKYPCIVCGEVRGGEP